MNPQALKMRLGFARFLFIAFSRQDLTGQSLRQQPIRLGAFALSPLRLCLCADRRMVPTHLPLAWTHSSALEEQKLLSVLEDLAKAFQPH